MRVRVVQVDARVSRNSFGCSVPRADHSPFVSLLTNQPSQSVQPNQHHTVFDQPNQARPVQFSLSTNQPNLSGMGGGARRSSEWVGQREFEERHADTVLQSVSLVVLVATILPATALLTSHTLTPVFLLFSTHTPGYSSLLPHPLHSHVQEVRSSCLFNSSFSLAHSVHSTHSTPAPHHTLGLSLKFNPTALTQTHHIASRLFSSSSSLPPSSHTHSLSLPPSTRTHHSSSAQLHPSLSSPASASAHPRSLSHSPVCLGIDHSHFVPSIT